MRALGQQSRQRRGGDEPTFGNAEEKHQHYTRFWKARTQHSSTLAPRTRSLRPWWGDEHHCRAFFSSPVEVEAATGSAGQSRALSSSCCWFDSIQHTHSRPRGSTASQARGTPALMHSRPLTLHSKLQNKALADCWCRTQGVETHNRACCVQSVFRLRT